MRITSTVSSSSTIQVRANTFSVPSRLIGQTRQVVLREAELELYLGTQRADTLPCLCDRHQAAINYPQYLAELTQRECRAQDHRRIARLLATSKLPPGKTWDQFDWERLPEKAARHLRNLRDGAFLDRATNVLLFGRPGAGKTHALAALGERLAHQGRSVLLTSCSLLVQDLLAAKRDLKLHRRIKRLQTFEAFIIDDLGYASGIVIVAQAEK